MVTPRLAITIALAAVARISRHLFARPAQGDVSACVTAARHGVASADALRVALGAVCVALAVLLALPARAQEHTGETAELDLVEIERTATRVLRLHSDALRADDRERGRCIDAVLSQIDASMRLVLERLEHRRAALARGDTDEARRQERLIRRVRDHARELSTRATQCVEPWFGREHERERTVVTTIIDPDVPSDAVRTREPPRTLADAHAAE